MCNLCHVGATAAQLFTCKMTPSIVCSSISRPAQNVVEKLQCLSIVGCINNLFKKIRHKMNVLSLE